jgi:folylpolyglutamate synthase/dihydropteroate synthase
VTTLRERIAVNSQPISEHAFNALVSQQEASLTSAQEEEGGAVSHFEAMTALAYKYFQEQQVSWSSGDDGARGRALCNLVFHFEYLASV